MPILLERTLSTSMSILKLFFISLTASILCLISVYILLNPSSETYDNIVYLANKIEFCEQSEDEFPHSTTVFSSFYDEVLYNSLIQQKITYFKKIEIYIMLLACVYVVSSLFCLYLVIYSILKYL